MATGSDGRPEGLEAMRRGTAAKTKLDAKKGKDEK
jgi:hypothetical protein